MKSIFKLQLLIPFVLLIAGCAKELIPDKNGYKPSIVIWAILMPDSSVKVISTGNRGISDENQVNIPSIDFFLYEDSIRVSSLYSQSINTKVRTHTFDYKAIPGRLYRLVIFNQNIKLEAEIKMINALNKPETIEISSGVNAQLKYVLQDDINTVDAYQFDVEIINIGILSDTANQTIINPNYFYLQKSIRFEEPSLNYSLLGLNSINTGEYTFPLDDQLFNGKKKNFLFTLSNPVGKTLYVPRTTSAGITITDKLECKKRYVLIRCRDISTEYYKFIDSENQNNSIYGTPYFNPTNLYTNVTGGLGLMASMSERVDTVWVFR